MFFFSLELLNYNQIHYHNNMKNRFDYRHKDPNFGAKYMKVRLKGLVIDLEVHLPSLLHNLMQKTIQQTKVYLSNIIRSMQSKVTLVTQNN